MTENPIPKQLAEQRTRRAERQAVDTAAAEAVRSAIQSGRYTIAVYYMDGEKLEQGLHQVAFPFAEFTVAEQHFRTTMAHNLRKRNAPAKPEGNDKPQPALAILDELLAEPNQALPAEDLDDSQPGYQPERPMGPTGEGQEP